MLDKRMPRWNKSRMTSSHRFDISGQIAFVTGAGRGIGKSIALGLASAGADIVLAGRDFAALEEACSDIEALGRRALPLELDLRDVPAIAAAFDQAEAVFGPVSILINNAGTENVRRSIDVTESLWDEIVDTNLKGAFFASQAAARHMLKRKAGSIINLCSLTSYVGVPTAAPYGSSKTGLLGMTRALSTEWAAHGLRVNAIAPGYFRTGMTEVFYADEGWRETMLPKIPQARFGQLEDLQGVAIFLASSASAYVTGQCIAVDGGYLAAL
jgi:NAD(P)-dependent dehydrogenase (short-subunit alcohol dehydrogenase family)